PATSGRSAHRVQRRREEAAKPPRLREPLSTCCLTVKLRGRPPRPEGRHGRTLSTGARGAKPLTPHGPLQRLLGGSDVPSVWLPKLYANILGTVRLLARHDCLYPFLSGLVTESKRLEVGDGRDSRITDAVRPRA